MNKLQNKRIIFGALLGALFMILAFAAIPIAGAEPLRQDATPVPNDTQCVGCHEGLRGYWEQSAHGYAMTDPIFQKAWVEQGSPQECLNCHSTGFNPETGEFTEGGVGCLTCHSPVPAGHPDAYMPTDVSSRLCGNCHLDTFAEWEISEHGQQGMTCNQCHNPHTAELRVESSQQLCNSCHNTEGHYYTFTGHAREGLLCTDCHLRINDSPEAGTMGHGERVHTFKIDLKSCNDCHLGDMHAEADETMTNASIKPQADVTCYPVEKPTTQEASFVPARKEVTAYVSSTPTGPGPLIYVLPVGFGIVFGAMLAPWLERVSKRRNNKNQKGDE
ncbi:MAG: hypothetical protein KJ046_08740 [Anaerolineae bacterium]|nr:hypothetical protein [Anaerolineae bacterium]